MKKFDLYLKEPHLKVINELKEKFSILNDKDMIDICVKSALNLKNSNYIFDSKKEKCRGGCYASKPQFKIKMNEVLFNKLKKIYMESEFDDYKTETESVSKVVRCIIDFFEDKPDLITLI